MAPGTESFLVCCSECGSIIKVKQPQEAMPESTIVGEQYPGEAAKMHTILMRSIRRYDPSFQEPTEKES